MVPPGARAPEPAPCPSDEPLPLLLLGLRYLRGLVMELRCSCGEAWGRAEMVASGSRA